MNSDRKLLALLAAGQSRGGGSYLFSTGRDPNERGNISEVISYLDSEGYSFPRYVKNEEIREQEIYRDLENLEKVGLINEKTINKSRRSWDPQFQGYKVTGEGKNLIESESDLKELEENFMKKLPEVKWEIRTSGN